MTDVNSEDFFCPSQSEKLFRLLYPRLCDFADYLLRDKELAEDMVQDSFIIYLEQREKLPANFKVIKSFLFTTVKNGCLNRLRHQNVVEVYNKKNPLEIINDPQILEGIIHAEVIAEIYEKINALPRGCAMVIRYGYLEGLSNSEIGKLMNISINTVKSQKKRALDLMKIHLSKTALALFIAVFLKT